MLKEQISSGCSCKEKVLIVDDTEFNIMTVIFMIRSKFPDIIIDEA